MAASNSPGPTRRSRSWAAPSRATELDDPDPAGRARLGCPRRGRNEAVDVEREGDRVSAVIFRTADGPRTVRCRMLIVADGVRSPLGKVLGRRWHRDTTYGVARGPTPPPRAATIRGSPRTSNCATTRARPAGLRLGVPARHRRGEPGSGNLATASRPASGSLRPLIDLYARQRRTEWELGEVTRVASALLPWAEPCRGSRAGTGR